MIETPQPGLRGLVENQSSPTPSKIGNSIGDMDDRYHADSAGGLKRRRLWQIKPTGHSRLGLVASMRERETTMRTLRGYPTQVSYWPFIKDFASPANQVFKFPSDTMGTVPPFACGFSKVEHDGALLLAVVDEDGNIILLDSMKCRAGNSYHDDTGRYKWSGHSNAIFDLAWADTSSSLVTASGDHTVKLWDVSHGIGRTFKGHSCSVKSVCFRPNDQYVFASGGRDGNIMLWDSRNAGSHDPEGEVYYKPANTIHNAHSIAPTVASSASSAQRRRRRQIPAADTKQSVTSVCFLRDPHLLASSGAADGVIKIWDLRRTYGTHTQTAQPVVSLHYLGEAGRKRGFTNLTIDSTGQKLLATCTDGWLYMYDCINTGEPHARIYQREMTSCSFYVRSALSPDDRYIISGSPSKGVYLWDVNQSDPVALLEGHEGEVTAVAWSPFDMGQIATCGDDNTLRLWTMMPNRPPSSPDNQDHSSVKILVPNPSSKWKVNDLDETPTPTGTLDVTTPISNRPSVSQLSSSGQSSSIPRQQSQLSHFIIQPHGSVTTPVSNRRRNGPLLATSSGLIDLPTNGATPASHINQLNNREVLTQSDPLQEINNTVNHLPSTPLKCRSRLVNSDIRSFWTAAGGGGGEEKCENGHSIRQPAVMNVTALSNQEGQGNNPIVNKEDDEGSMEYSNGSATIPSRIAPRLPFPVRSIASYFLPREPS